MPAPPKLLELVARFREQQEAYTSGRYKEAQLRKEFVDPLLRLLGWDVENEQGYAEPYKEVIHEDTLKTASGTKAPDYGLRIGGVLKYLIEAKEPSVNLKDDPSPAYQLRRYAWNAKLPLSILTDFEEFAVYDCRFQPFEKDKASVARVMYLRFDELREHWDEIYGIFSREAILRGAFDRFAASSAKKRGTAEVDNAFLAEVANWRKLLATNVAARNPALQERELNFVVQRTIDRIIFLRICEDRGIETPNRLREASEGPGVYERLSDLFRSADDRYNSGLFHFKSEQGRDEAPDSLTLGVAIDDGPLRQILKSMYYPESPYEFSVLPPEILGHVYEQLLGSVIRLSPKRRVQIEEKPRVRKAGGVYYTPKSVVDYIVRRTVGLQLEGKKPGAQVSRLRIVDTSCGSGSFLIAAYQYLLDWYRDRYVEAGPERYRTQLHEVGPNSWRLSTPERKRILLNHVFGVDIDAQAVEVTKLSLVLKVLEGENDQSITRQIQLLHDRALPDLERNIKCGNTLIEPAVVSHSLFPDQQLMERINPFDWNAEFPEIMGRGGFDCVIGNPPYIRIQTLSEVAPEEAEMYKRLYRSAATGNFDIYVAFVEKALSLLVPTGRMGFIVPSKFFTTDYGQALRSLLTSRPLLQEVIDFGHEQIFNNATTYTCLLFAGPTPTDGVDYAKVDSISLPLVPPPFRRIPSEQMTAGSWTFRSDKGQTIAAKLAQHSAPLLALPAEMSRGSSTGDDETFILTRSGRELVTRQGKAVQIEADLLRSPISASDFGRYWFRAPEMDVIIFPYRNARHGFELIPESDLKRSYPRAYEYLHSRKKQLTARAQYQEWWAYSAPRNLEVHERAQMLVPLLADRGLVGELSGHTGGYCLMASGGFSITVDTTRTRLSPRYVLGLLNSSLLFWQLKHISNKFRGGYVTCTKQYVGTLPVRLLDLDDAEQRDDHDQIVSLVGKLVGITSERNAATIPSDATMLDRQLAIAERELDDAVFALYGLTMDEAYGVKAELAKPTLDSLAVE
ncbi:MAG TPA: N-6 DNA methylase [Candidatus Eisenbacteria bacterium]|nr:N-6 DNA methylase [Candidatus Eisenbacteria bacterium]